MSGVAATAMGLGFLGWVLGLGGGSAGRWTTGNASTAVFSSTTIVLSFPETAVFGGSAIGSSVFGSFAFSFGLPRMSCAVAATISFAGITSPSTPAGCPVSGSGALLLDRRPERNDGLV